MILERIIRHKKKEVLAAKKRRSLGSLKSAAALLPSRKTIFLPSLRRGRKLSFIAEIKKKSPSKGILRRNFDPVKIAKAYERAGASALSVLTDWKFFGGSPRVLRAVRNVTHLPILRKDFIIDEYQIWESRLLGADGVLLIAAILSERQLKKFMRLSKKLGLSALVEVHTIKDTRKALRVKAELVGINNRDLRTFRVDLAQTKRLALRFKKNVFLVSESGIQSAKDLIYLKRCGVGSVLIGESLMRQKNPGEALKRLIAGAHG